MNDLSRCMRTTVRIKDDLLRRAKKRAAKEGRKLASALTWTGWPRLRSNCKLVSEQTANLPEQDRIPAEGGRGGRERNPTSPKACRGEKISTEMPELASQRVFPEKHQKGHHRTLQQSRRGMEHPSPPRKQRLAQEPTHSPSRANGRKEFPGNRGPEELLALVEAEVDRHPDLSRPDFFDQLFPGQDLAKTLNDQGNVK